MYCRCERAASWPFLIRPCSSILTGCVKSLISHQRLAHVHLLGAPLVMVETGENCCVW